MLLIIGAILLLGIYTVMFICIMDKPYKYTPARLMNSLIRLLIACAMIGLQGVCLADYIAAGEIIWPSVVLLVLTGSLLIEPIVYFCLGIYNVRKTKKESKRRMLENRWEGKDIVV
ncbi:MAG: hypothetical protein IJ272_03720 [Clostridia bacterium]|nr:hypothetical protein [Clostridia bacterium]